jgi:FAD/FMN-containing dehydrogenase
MTRSGPDSEEIWKLRHAASPILAAMADTVTSMQIIEDGAVPPPHLAEYVRGVRALLTRHGFAGVLFGHAVDGHLHANVLADVRQHDWKERLGRAFDDAVALTAKLGGTLSGEHGDGRLRAATLDRIWPPAAVERFRMIKDAFDPRGILNPGVKFAAAGAPAFGAPVKYDPALAPLPPAARRALDRVQRERAWHRSRIELLDEERRR